MAVKASNPMKYFIAYNSVVAVVHLRESTMILHELYNINND